MDGKVNSLSSNPQIPRDFEAKYGARGGFEKLLELYYQGKSYVEIGARFVTDEKPTGLSRQRIYGILTPLVREGVIPSRNEIKRENIRDLVSRVLLKTVLKDE